MIGIAAFTIRELGRAVAVEGETPSGLAARGRGRLVEIVDGDAVRLTVRDTVWDNGERDLVASERHDSPQRFDTLVERLRLSVAQHGGELYAELRQVRLKPNGRGNLFVPDRAELDEAAGVDVAAELERHGGRVGRRSELLADEGRTKDRLGVLFPAEAQLVPVVVYVCTRVAPVASDVRA
jgi:hypothetical protein